jgi:DNA-binding transcriptional LysR family regulator
MSPWEVSVAGPASSYAISRRYARSPRRARSGAADRLGFTQSAISQQIAILERRIGHRLIERSKGRRSVALTEAGEVLLAHARAILGLVELAYLDFTEFECGRRGPRSAARPARPIRGELPPRKNRGASGTTDSMLPA